MLLVYTVLCVLFNMAIFYKDKNTSPSLAPLSIYFSKRFLWPKMLPPKGCWKGEPPPPPGENTFSWPPTLGNGVKLNPRESVCKRK